MAKVQEATADPTRTEREAREKASRILLLKHKGKSIKNLSKAELDDVITAILQILSFVDKDGLIK